MDAVDRLFALIDSQFPEQKDFAAQLGITPSIVSEWRRGKSESFTKQKYIRKIAEVLNTTTEYILTGKEESPPPEGGGLVQEFARIFDQLSPQAQNEIIAEMLKRQRQEK